MEEELDADRQINLLTDDSYTKQAVLTLISNVETYHRIQPYLLTCLHHLVKDLPGSIFGRQVNEFSSPDSGPQGVFHLKSVKTSSDFYLNLVF